MMEMMMGEMMSDVMGGPPKGKKGGKGGMGMGGGFMDMMGDDYDEEDGDLFGDDEYDSDEIEMIGKQMGLSKKELAELKRDLKSKYNAKLKNEEKKPTANASKKQSQVQEDEWGTDSEEEVIEKKPSATKQEEPCVQDDGDADWGTDSD